MESLIPHNFIGHMLLLGTETLKQTMPALYAQISLKYPDILRFQSTCISYGMSGDNNLAISLALNGNYP